MSSAVGGVAGTLDGIRAALAELVELAGENEWGAVDAFGPVRAALAAVLDLADEADADERAPRVSYRDAFDVHHVRTDAIRRAVASHLDPKENPNA